MEPIVVNLTFVRDVKKPDSGSQRREEVGAPTACISGRNRQRRHFLSGYHGKRCSDSLPKEQRPIASFTSAVSDGPPRTTHSTEVRGGHMIPSQRGLDSSIEKDSITLIIRDPVCIDCRVVCSTATAFLSTRLRSILITPHCYGCPALGGSLLRGQRRARLEVRSLLAYYAPFNWSACRGAATEGRYR
jgi:hypothetical protein